MEVPGLEFNELFEILSSLESIHFPSGPTHQISERLKASMYMPTNEFRSIYHLTESHSPSLRYRAQYRHEKCLQNSNSECFSINKENISFDCSESNINESIKKMLQRVEEMPKEWTIIQLTPSYNPSECTETSVDKHYTNSFYVTVFQCGKGAPKPFCITVDTPIDKISGDIIEIRQEIASIINDNKKSFLDLKVNDKKASSIEQHMYIKTRYNINNRLKHVVKDVQDIWLKEWRCLFMGKFMDEDEDMISKNLEGFLSNYEMDNVSEKVKSILTCLIKSSAYLKATDIKQIIKYCFPENKEIHVNLSKSIHDFGKNTALLDKKRHPIILAVDEKLDTLPWEMLDILQEHPVSRMPSLHFTYALFKEHENSIVDGVKINIDSKKGKYIINPSLDLKRMETRLHSFFKYWTPNWSGLVGVTPTSEEFEEMLVNSDIFAYNGHGSGSQFFPPDKVQRLRINSVVLLFGCGSVKYTNLGPQVEMYGASQMYLIACSPCVVGMLWEVTDCDTDILSTEFWSLWLPQLSQLHWKNVDKNKWETSGEIKPVSSKDDVIEPEGNEPELLRALSKARKSARQFLTQAGLVARGIPVRINS